MFKNLYVGELRKQCKPKTIITLSILMVVFFIIAALVYSLMADSLNQMFTEMNEQGIELPTSDSGYNFKNEAEVDEEIASVKMEMEIAKEAAKESGVLSNLSGDVTYGYESELELLNYIKDNKLYDRDVSVYNGSSSMFQKPTAEGFLELFYSFIVSIIGIYGVVLGAGIFSREMKEGTLKMMFMRPVKRSQVTTAKLLAMLSIITGLMVVGTLIGYIYGLIAYGAMESTTVYFVFNATSVFKGTSGLATFMTLLGSYVEVIAFAVLAFAIGTLTKNRVAGVIIGIALLMGVGALFMQILGISAFTYTGVVGLLDYFTMGMGIAKGGNFWIALPLLAVYVGGVIYATYAVVNHRDLA